MRGKIIKRLLNVKNATISTDELEEIIPEVKTYDSFATLINEREQDTILQMVKARGRNTKTPSVALRYRINKHKLNRPYHEQLQHYRLKFHDSIDLDAYVWEQDLSYLEKINACLETNPLPTKKFPHLKEVLNWVSEQLESNSYKNEYGLEDTGKIRKEIETWLNTKQLLQVVMEGKGMKVSCRKVTNDYETA